MDIERGDMKCSDSRLGGIISGLFSAALIVLLVIVIGGIFVTRTIRIHETKGINGSDVAIETPEGRFNIRTRDNMNPAITGVPIYPGASRTKDSGGAQIEWSSNKGETDKNLYVIGGEFVTRDSASKVVEFYRNQLPNIMIVSKTGESTRLEYEQGSLQRIISIDESGGETRIKVASIGTRASN
jgi:hypothetical protein